MASIAGAGRPRLFALLFAVLAVFFVCSFIDGLTPRAVAQDDGGEEKKEGDSKEGKGEKSGGARPNLFLHILNSVGLFFGVTLLIVSIALVTLVVLLAMELRMGVAIPPGFVEEFTETVNKKRFKEAYELAKEDSSFVARVLTAGMSRLQYGIEDAREASFNMLESVKASKEQLIVYLATIGTLGPLLGLVGTVYGMILSFMTLSAGGTLDSKQLADDISHALVITLLGIGLSVPAIFCHALFRNRLIRVTHDAGTVADDLLTQMYYNSKKAASAPAVDDARAVPQQSIKPK